MENNVLTVNYAELKPDILNACIKEHRSLMENLTESIRNALMPPHLDNEDIREVSVMATQLESMRREIKWMYNMIPKIRQIHSTVQPGSVVITTKDIFFFSADIGPVDVNGIKILCLSINSPFYQAMEGNGNGYSFSISNVTYTIKEVF